MYEALLIIVSIAALLVGVAFVIEARSKSINKERRIFTEAGDIIVRFGIERFDKYGSDDARGAALWEAGHYLIKEYGNPRLRKRKTVCRDDQ